MNRSTKIAAVLVAAVVVISGLLVVFARNSENTPEVTVEVTHRNSYGNCVLDISKSDFLSAGFKEWDTVRISGDGFSHDAMVVEGYCGLKTMELFLNLSLNGSEIDLAYQFAMDNFRIGDKFTIRYIGDSDRVSEFPQYSRGLCERQAWMTDADYANCCNVAATGIAPGVLYRSSNAFGTDDRAACVGGVLEKAGVARIIGLNASEETVRNSISAGLVTDSYAVGLFENGDVMTRFMSTKFLQDPTYSEVFRYIADNDGPYDICCTLGKDRTGFVVYILEAIMGASLEEMEAGYNLSYVSLYDIKKDSEEYRHLDSMLIPIIVALHDPSTLDHIDDVDWMDCDITGYDYQADAESYLTNTLGLSDDTVNQIKAHLSGKSQS